MTLERLQKVLAEAGLASRRKCEELIVAGRVSVNGRVVTRLGAKVDPDLEEVRCDGDLIRSARRRYYAVNKPLKVVCTTADTHGRPQVTDLVSSPGERLYPVGRLDADSEGLVILTNDGALANRVMHPRYQVAKIYVVDVAGSVDERAERALRRGVVIDGVPAVAREARLIERADRATRLELTIAEGRKRIIRRMLKALGFPVIRLVRTQIGPVKLGALRPGASRPLTREELNGLLSAAVDPKKSAPRPASRRRPESLRLRDDKKETDRSPRGRKKIAGAPVVKTRGKGPREPMPRRRIYE